MSTAEHAHQEGKRFDSPTGKADWTPSLHPRDSQGRFTESGGGGVVAQTPHGPVRSGDIVKTENGTEHRVLPALSSLEP